MLKAKAAAIQQQRCEARDHGQIIVTHSGNKARGLILAKSVSSIEPDIFVNRFSRNN